MTKFETGQTYECRSFGDHNCKWTFEVTKRTTQFVTLKCDDGKTYRVKVRPGAIDDSVERCSPFGHYSLSPVLCADRPVAAR